MKKTRRTTEQIIRILRDSEGLSVDEACRKHEISAPTYHHCYHFSSMSQLLVRKVGTQIMCKFKV